VWAFASQIAADRAAPFPHVSGMGKFEAETLVLFGRGDAICSVVVGADEGWNEEVEAGCSGELRAFPVGRETRCLYPFFREVTKFLDVYDIIVSGNGNCRA
jgi:hypothetical protein